MFNLRYCATEDKYTRKNRNRSFRLHLSRINVVNFIDGPEKKRKEKRTSRIRGVRTGSQYRTRTRIMYQVLAKRRKKERKSGGGSFKNASLLWPIITSKFVAVSNGTS